MGFEYTHFAEFAWAQLEPEGSGSVTGAMGLELEPAEDDAARR